MNGSRDCLTVLPSFLGWKDPLNLRRTERYERCSNCNSFSKRIVGAHSEDYLGLEAPTLGGVSRNHGCPMLFRDRFEAGRLLASNLKRVVNTNDALVLALPRGGVPVGFEVAQALGVPLDVFVVRKLGVPGHEELAMGAIASGGVIILNEDVIRVLHIPEDVIQSVIAEEERELERRERGYRDGRPLINVEGRTVILVDDGLATGSSMRVAARALKKKNPARIIVAVPVAAPATCAELESEVDQVICAVTPEPFWAVGQWYRDFSQTSDEEVRELLRRAANLPTRTAA